MNRRIDSGALFTGVMLIAFGVIFLLDRLRVADFHYIIRTYWPMILVVLGIARMLKRNIWGGLWFIALAAWLQAIQLRLYGMTYANAWPLLLILMGAGMVVRTFVRPPKRESNES